MPRRLDGDKQQLSLFPTDLRHLAESIGLDWWAAKKLYDDKWLSFDPEINTTDSSSKEAEFIFLGTLVAAGCDPRMLKRLLETLEKPYCYGLSGMYYDWEKRCWMDHDLPSQTAAKIVSGFEDDGDAASLKELKERVQEAINRLNGDEGEQYPDGDKPSDVDLAIENTDLESARSALDELFKLARHYRKSKKFLDLIRFVANFRLYSAFNAMMVHIQMPGAKYVLPAKKWLKKYHRLPIPDAQPLIMLQPMSPIMFGYDVSQTTGRALPDGFDNPLKASGSLKKGDFEMTMANAKHDGVRVTLKSLGSLLGGYVRDPTSLYYCAGFGVVVDLERPTMPIDGREVPVIADITLNANLSHETNYATLVHELGHLYCGHLGTPDPRWWLDRSNLDGNVKEFEAESVSYLVCQRAGIDTPAVEYLNGYLYANEEVPDISLEAVFKVAQRIEAMRMKKMKSRILEYVERQDV